jgi:pyrimidine operon attenuation protein / uracil phosphoribosyltransferase
MKRTLILNQIQIEQKIKRMAWQLFEDHFREKELIIAGIAGRGYTLAEHLISVLKEIDGCPALHLLDLKVNKQNPLSDFEVNISNPSYLEGKVIVVVDDVLNSGRTLLYGVKKFMIIPVKKIATLVLVDRNHRSFPVNADYVGLSLATTLLQNIQVVLSAEEKAVYLED